MPALINLAGPFSHQLFFFIISQDPAHSVKQLPIPGNSAPSPRPF